MKTRRFMGRFSSKSRYEKSLCFWPTVLCASSMMPRSAQPVGGGRRKRAPDADVCQPTVGSLGSGPANQVSGVHPGRSVAFGIPDATLGTDVIVMICELQQPLDESLRAELELLIRRRVWEQEVALHDVRLVDERWLIKTSSGKISRAASREKYLASLAHDGTPREA